jgi:hypothetical protein
MGNRTEPSSNESGRLGNLGLRLLVKLKTRYGSATPIQYLSLEEWKVVSRLAVEAGELMLRRIHNYVLDRDPR